MFDIGDLLKQNGCKEKSENWNEGIFTSAGLLSASWHNLLSLRKS
jgi:hypothetical protein